MLTASELERELVILVGMIRRLSPPLHQRPALFLEQKDALADFAERLRDRIAGRGPSPRSFSSPTTDTGITRLRAAHGRTITVERRS